MPERSASDMWVHYIELAANPSLIVDLTLAQLRSPLLQQIADKHINTHKNSQKLSKPALFAQIQQYLHDHTYHMVRKDRLEFFGWDNIDDLYKQFGKARVDKSIEVIIGQLISTGRQDLADQWKIARKSGKVLRGLNTVFDNSLEMGKKRRGKPALQCGDETTVAAALCMLKADLKIDQLIFIGSSFHTLVYIDYKDGYLFDSKMLYDRTAIKKFKKAGGLEFFTSKLGEVEWLATADGYCDFSFKKYTLDDLKFNKIKQLLNNFTGGTSDNGLI